MLERVLIGAAIGAFLGVCSWLLLLGVRFLEKLLRGGGKPTDR